jgi:hypothetical protein
MGELKSAPGEEARKIFDVNVWGATNVAREPFGPSGMSISHDEESCGPSPPRLGCSLYQLLGITVRASSVRSSIFFKGPMVTSSFTQPTRVSP